MKKLFFSAVVLMLSTVTFAHDTPSIPLTSTAQIVSPIQVITGYLKMGDKMFILEGNQKVEQTEDVTLKNGTLVTKEGVVKPKDGESVTLENGQYVDLDGNIKTWKEDGK